MTTPAHLIAFGLGTGLSPVAPGTMGTLLAVPLAAVLLMLPWEAYLAIVAVFSIFGCWVCGQSTRLLEIDDYGGIVFDEVVGYLLTCVALLPALNGPEWGLWIELAAAFVLFRIMDVAKPWPIRWLDEHLHGGIGIMADDLLAGIGAGALLWGISYLINLWEWVGT